jgi:hypothetical protein
MLTKLLLSSTLLLTTGCVERGYQLKVNQNTHTISAIKSIDLHQNKAKTTKNELKQMTNAVKKEQKKQALAHHIKEKAASKKIILKTDKKTVKKTDYKDTSHLTPVIKINQPIIKKENISIQKIEATKKAEASEAALLKREKEAQQLLAKKEEAIKQAKRKEEALQKKYKEALEAKKAEKEKEAQKVQEALKAEKEEQARLTLEEAEPESKVDLLQFKATEKTYQKFGSSEIHGHVVYLTPNGEEVRLENTKIYLVPNELSIEYWYNYYYLKSNESSLETKTTISYLNVTHLDAEKNFAFFGLSEGIYYIVIEGEYPTSANSYQKIYIAKKIKVEKYKKIMTVFNKTL